MSFSIPRARLAAAACAAALCGLPVAATAGTPEAVLRVHLLGTGNPLPSMERFGSATLIQAGDRYLLIDAGRGTLLRLGQLVTSEPGGTLLPVPGTALAVDRVFLTHLHSDHVVGLPDLWLSGWFYRNERPLRVSGPAGTAELVRGLESAFAFDVGVRQDMATPLPAAGSTLVAREISEGRVLEDGDLAVIAIAVDHGHVAPALGYRIEYAGRSVVISGDTRPSDSLARAAASADVLVHEVAAADDAFASSERGRHVLELHTTARQAGRLFRQANPRLAVFSHIVLLGDVGVETLEEQARESWDGPLWTGADLDVIEVGDEITVLRHGRRALAVPGGRDSTSGTPRR